MYKPIRTVPPMFYVFLIAVVVILAAYLYIEVGNAMDTVITGLGGSSPNYLRILDGIVW